LLQTMVKHLHADIYKRTTGIPTDKNRGTYSGILAVFGVQLVRISLSSVTACCMPIALGLSCVDSLQQDTIELCCRHEQRSCRPGGGNVHCLGLYRVRCGESKEARGQGRIARCSSWRSLAATMADAAPTAMICM
jgi:hypothetical protein